MIEGVQIVQLQRQARNLAVALSYGATKFRAPTEMGQAPSRDVARVSDDCQVVLGPDSGLMRRRDELAVMPSETN